MKFFASEDLSAFLYSWEQCIFIQNRADHSPSPTLTVSYERQYCPLCLRPAVSAHGDKMCPGSRALQADFEGQGVMHLLLRVKHTAHHTRGRPLSAGTHEASGLTGPSSECTSGELVRAPVWVSCRSQCTTAYLCPPSDSMVFHTVRY